MALVSKELAGGISDVPVFNVPAPARKKAVIAEEQQTPCSLVLVFYLETRLLHSFVPDEDSRLIRAGREELFFCPFVVREPADIIDGTPVIVCKFIARIFAET